MNVEIFVQNIKTLCKEKGVKPTIACEESGAGKNLLNHIETRGSIPSVAKVQMLADYLGVTTSELLGETKKGPVADGHEPSENELLFRSLPPDRQEEALRYMRYLASQGAAPGEGQDR